MAADEVKKDTNPKAGAGTNRIPLSLFPRTAVAYGALGMTEGHLKYGGYNYREKGVLVSTYLDAADRHRNKFEDGEWADPVTGIPHLASWLACVAILVDGFVKGNITDDRPPKLLNPTPTEFYSELEQKVKHLKEVFPEENSPGRYTALPKDTVLCYSKYDLETRCLEPVNHQGNHRNNLLIWEHSICANRMGNSAYICWLAEGHEGQHESNGYKWT